MARQSKKTFKSLGVSRAEAENIRAALALLEETEKQEEKEAYKESQRRAAQQSRELGFLDGVRKLVILYKNWEQYPHEEKQHQWYKRYENLREQLEGAMGEERVKQQFELDYLKYRVGEDLSAGRLR
jgi:flagellar biosynthesis/type III secretory pathway protein FliH